MGFQPGRLVMSAPFLSIPDMALHLLGQLPALVMSLLSPSQQDIRELRFLRKTLGAANVVASSLKRPSRVLLDVIVPHRWDNTSAIRSAVQAGWQIGIVHGAEDKLVPAQMGRELHSLACKMEMQLDMGSERRSHWLPAEFVEVPSASHNDVILSGFPSYSRLMGFQE